MNGRYPAALNGSASEPALRVPPHNSEAEEGVIASVILDNKILTEIREFLSSADFWRDKHQILFRACETLADQETPITGITLANLLIQRDQLRTIGGDDALHELVNRHVLGAGPLHFALIVKEYSVRRQVIESAERITREAYACQTTAQALAREFEAAGRNLLERNMVSASNPIQMFSDIEERELEWLWQNRVPLGCLTTFAGVGGLGKSLVTLDLAARITTGKHWPDSDRPQQPRSVLLISAEDPHDTVTKMRLRYAGANMDRIATLKPLVMDRFDLGQIEVLERAADQLPDCGLLIIDPPTALLPRDLDDHKNSPLRALLAPLASFAERRRIAVILITHVSKAASNRAADKIIGSVAYVNAVRAAWIFAKDDEDPQRRRFSPVKNNLAPFVGTLSYRINPKLPIVEWETGEEDCDADEIVTRDANSKRKRPRIDPKRPSPIADWLIAELSDGFPHAIVAIVEAGRAAGHLASPSGSNSKPSISPLYNARDRIPELKPGFSVIDLEAGNERGRPTKYWQLISEPEFPEGPV